MATMRAESGPLVPHEPGWGAKARKAADDQDGAADRVVRAVHAHGALKRQQQQQRRELQIRPLLLLLCCKTASVPGSARRSDRGRSTRRS
jgi:hypothetical protein